MWHSDSPIACSNHTYSRRCHHRKPAPCNPATFHCRKRTPTSFCELPLQLRSLEVALSRGETSACRQIAGEGESCGATLYVSTLAFKRMGCPPCFWDSWKAAYYVCIYIYVCVCVYIKDSFWVYNVTQTHTCINNHVRYIYIHIYIYIYLPLYIIIYYIIYIYIYISFMCLNNIYRNKHIFSPW